MIIAGIIFIAYGIITSGLKESLSTWKFITGAAASLRRRLRSDLRLQSGRYRPVG